MVSKNKNSFCGCVGCSEVISFASRPAQQQVGRGNDGFQIKPGMSDVSETATTRCAGKTARASRG